MTDRFEQAAARRARRRRRGFTLIESVVSLVIVSVLLTGLSASVMLAARAIPSEGEIAVVDREAQDICNMLREDLAACSEISYQVYGSIVRLKLKMLPSDTAGTMTYSEWEFIPDLSMIRRRIDSASYRVITMNMSKYEIDFVEEDNEIRYVHIILQFDKSMQRVFELHIQTPYRPLLK